jgi:hypothetical protein
LLLAAALAFVVVARRGFIARERRTALAHQAAQLPSA